MVLPFNRANVDVACLGNHDFDYDLDYLVSLMKQTQTPWLLSNVFNPTTGRNLADALPHHVLTVNGVKVGFMGLAEQEWLGQINTVPSEWMEYRDYLQTAIDIAHKLRHQHHCQVVIALTHMRIARDQHLLHSLPPGTVDLVLGGHDHIWHHEHILDSFYLKSGTNFRNIGFVKVTLAHSHQPFDKHQLWDDPAIFGEYKQYHLGSKLTIDFV